MEDEADLVKSEDVRLAALMKIVSLKSSGRSCKPQNNVRRGATVVREDCRTSKVSGVE